MSRMKKTHRPVVLTQILDRLERLEAVEAIRLGMAAAEDGWVRPARTALAELQARLRIPG